MTDRDLGSIPRPTIISREQLGRLGKADQGDRGNRYSTDSELEPFKPEEAPSIRDLLSAIDEFTLHKIFKTACDGPLSRENLANAGDARAVKIVFDVLRQLNIRVPGGLVARVGAHMNSLDPATDEYDITAAVWRKYVANNQHLDDVHWRVFSAPPIIELYKEHPPAADSAAARFIGLLAYEYPQHQSELRHARAIITAMGELEQVVTRPSLLDATMSDDEVESTAQAVTGVLEAHDITLEHVDEDSRRFEAIRDILRAFGYMPSVKIILSDTHADVAQIWDDVAHDAIREVINLCKDIPLDVLRDKMRHTSVNYRTDIVQSNLWRCLQQLLQSGVNDHGAGIIIEAMMYNELTLQHPALTSLQYICSPTQTENDSES